MTVLLPQRRPHPRATRRARSMSSTASRCDACNGMSGSVTAPLGSPPAPIALPSARRDADDEASGPSEVLSLDASPLPEVRQALIVEALERRDLFPPAIEDQRERRCSAVAKVGTDREGGRRAARKVLEGPRIQNVTRCALAARCSLHADRAAVATSRRLPLVSA